MIRVSVRPAINCGLNGWTVRWVDRGGKKRSYFVLTLSDARHTKRRAKEEKLPLGWAVKA